MRTELQGDVLTLFVEGHVDSKNAASFEADVMAALDSVPGASAVFDLEGLEYVSSAGLRVFMKAMKHRISAPSAELPHLNSRSRKRVCPGHASM